MSSIRNALLAGASLALIATTPALAQATITVAEGDAWYPAPNEETVITASSIVIEGGAALVTGEPTSGSGPTVTNRLEDPTVLVFTNPAATFDNDGYILIGPDTRSTSWTLARHEAELRFEGLNEFRHSGSILLGIQGYPYPSGDARIDGNAIESTDRWYDDIMVFEDGTWIGEGGNVVFDVDTTLTQSDCTRTAVTNDFAAADCLRIVDSTIEGQTYVTVAEITPGDRGRLTQQIMDEGIVLIEVPGSTVTADSFVLDPTMRSYNPDSETLDKGLYQYALLFDEAAGQFKLFGTLSGAAYQLPMAASAAHDLWRLSTAGWLERQADLRGGIEEGVGGGIWMRASGEQTDRDVTSTSTLGGLPFSVDNTHQTRSYAVTGGVDLVAANTDDMAYVVGVMGGYAHADVEYDAFANTQAMDGWTAGLYASFVSGGLFVDAAVNANNVILDTDAPGFNLLPEGTILSSRLTSVGGQIEAGWRLPIGEGLFAEPLAGLSYVRSELEDLQIKPDDHSRPGLVVSYDDPTSLRASLGGRLGLERDFGAARAEFTLLGRLWNELEGENTASIHNLAFPDDPDIAVVDDFSGQFTELAVGASLYSPGGVVSGFVNLGGKFGDDYSATTGTIGVRVNW